MMTFIIVCVAFALGAWMWATPTEVVDKLTCRIAQLEADNQELKKHIGRLVAQRPIRCYVQEMPAVKLESMQVQDE